MSLQTKIILLTLGEELLLGLTANTHLTYIGSQLRQGGALLHANLTLSDSPEDIEQHFRHYWELADVVITTGGLGPTVDDRTKDIIAQVLGETLVFDSEIMAAIEARFATLGRPTTENNRKQAYRFKNAFVLPNPNGTAPGLWFEKSGKTLVMLPGPPNELQPMFESEVVPRFQARGWLQSAESYLQIRTVSVGESALETMLQPILAPHSSLEVAYCAHQGMVDFRISFPNQPERYGELIAIAAECRGLLGENFLCCGHDSIVKVVSDMLRRRDLTLALAESCTGGLISSEFTDLPGASDFFMGGLTAYSSEMKSELLGVPEELIQQHTAVSSEVALAMAAGVSEKLETDYAISTTGYLGPLGGGDATPVGTVYIGLHSPRGIWAKKFTFKGSRTTIKRRVVNVALDWLRRELMVNIDSQDHTHEALRAESAKILRSLK